MKSHVAPEASQQTLNIQDELGIPEYFGEHLISGDDSDLGNCIMVAPSVVSSREKASASACNWRSEDVLTRYVQLLKSVQGNADGDMIQLLWVLRYSARNLHA